MNSREGKSGWFMKWINNLSSQETWQIHSSSKQQVQWWEYAILEDLINHTSKKTLSNMAVSALQKAAIPKVTFSKLGRSSQHTKNLIPFRISDDMVKLFESSWSANTRVCKRGRSIHSIINQVAWQNQTVCPIKGIITWNEWCQIRKIKSINK